MTFLEYSLTEHIDGSTQVVYETTTDRIQTLPNGDKRIDLSVHNEFPFGLNELKNAIDHNPWLGCDYHIEDEKQCDLVLAIINRYVKSNDHFIILGDLDARHNEPRFSIVERFVRGLYTKNIYLLLGNNDSFPVKDYKRIGFKAVFTEFAYKNMIFTHFPIGAENGKINIHAHLHGVGNPENKGLDAYWFCDGRNCIDVWDDEYRPIKLSDILEKFSGLHVTESVTTNSGLNTLDIDASVCQYTESSMTEPLENFDTVSISTRIYHGSPVQNLTEIVPHTNKAYENLGDVLFASPRKDFASCFGFDWHDGIAKQRTNDGTMEMIFSEEIERKIRNQKASIYELENDGEWVYLPNHPNEIVHIGPASVKKEIKYQSALSMMKTNGVTISVKEEIPVTEAADELYYRITYRGEGVYQALKNATPATTWKKMQLSPVFDWLPRPPFYLDGMKSYFTKLGLDYFDKYTRPTMEIYLDKRLMVTETKEGPMHIVYRDKFQVVEDAVTKPKDDGLWRSILRFNYNTNNMYYYVHNRNYEGPADNKAFQKYYYVLSPKEFGRYEGGVCWDYVAYQADYFKKNYPSLDYKVFYMMSIHEDPDDVPTHTFMLFKYENKWFWFESSWKPYMGIWEFSSIPAALTYITNAHKLSVMKKPGISRFKMVSISEYNPLDETLFGLTCEEFMERMAGMKEYAYPKRSRLPSPKHYYDEAQYMDINGPKPITESIEEGGDEDKMTTEATEEHLFYEFNSSTELDILEKQDSLMMEDAQWSTVNRYPVYIVLQHSGTPMANLIKKVTRDEYSHAAIAFNTKLDPLYSFGTKTLKPLTLGFSVQHRGDEFYKDFTVSYGVYVMYLDKRQYRKVMEKLQWFIKNDNKLGYSIPGLITCGLQIPHQFRNKFVCSHFVMTLVGEGTKLSKDPSIWKPQDITTLNNITLVNKGENFRFYKEAITIANLRKVRSRQFNALQLQESVMEESEVIDSNTITALELPKPNLTIAYTEEAYDYYLEQANYNKKNIYPVFIVLTAAESPMAKAIIKITKQPWSHALISFNTKLDPAYSFGCTSFKPLRFGFISKNEEDPFRDSEVAKYAVYVMYVNKKQYTKMHSKLNEFIANKNDLKYSWKGLPRLLTKRTKEYPNEYFCSQFVMKIIGEAMPIEKDPQLWTPGDIEFLKNISLVATGPDLRKFKPSVLRRNLKYIQQKQFDKVKLECAVEIESKIDDPAEQLYLETTIDANKNFFKERVSPRVDNVLSTSAGKQRFNKIVNDFIDRNITKLTKSGPCDMVAFTDRDHKSLFDLFGFAYTIDARPRVTSPNEITTMIKEFSKEEGINLRFFETNPSQVLLYYVIRYFTMNPDEKSLNSALAIYALCVYPLMFHKYFPYGVIEPFMQYTIDNLTNKFTFKKSKHLFGALMTSIRHSYSSHRENFPKGNDAHMVAWVERIRNDQNSLFKKISNEYNKNYKAGNAARQTNEQFDKDTPIVDEVENATTLVQNIVQKVALPIIESGVDLLRAEAAAKMGGVSVSDCRFFLTNILISKNITTMQTFIEAILFLYIYEDKKTERDIRSQYFLAWAASLFKKTNSKNKNISTINTILNDWAEDSGVYKKFIREASRINYKKAIFYYVILCIQKSV